MAVGLTFWTYFRNPRFSSLPIWSKRVGVVLRFLALGLIAFLLSDPVVKWEVTQEKMPVLVFLTDNSASMLKHADKVAISSRLSLFQDSLIDDLKKTFEIRHFQFGSSFRKADTLNFVDTESNYYNAIHSAFEALEGNPLRAIILTGDGRFNRGPSPIHVARNFNIPIFCLMTGDTLSQANSSIVDLRYNQMTLLGNNFPVEVTVTFSKMRGRRAKLKLLTESGQVADSKEINIAKDFDVRHITFYHSASTPGLLAYRVIVDAGEETFRSDNARRFFIEAVNNRTRVLIAADAPHPDIGAILQALSLKKNLETEVIFADQLPENPKDYHVIIAHQLPGTWSGGVNFLRKAWENKIPVWLITGPHTTAFGLQQLQQAISLSGTLPNRTDDYYISLNSNFSAFSLSPDISLFLTKVPPLESTFGNYQLPTTGEILFYRKIGHTTSLAPLSVFNSDGGFRSLYWVGTGLWRWRFFNYEKYQNHELFDEFINKIVQYLSLADDRSRFRVQAPQLLYENQDAVFSVELYNKSYELVNTSEAKLILADSVGRRFSYNFLPEGKAYRLNVGMLAPGRYTYEATTIYNSEKFSKKGLFIVAPSDLESSVKGSDFNTLLALSRETRGKAYYWMDAVELPMVIRESVDSRKIIWTETLTGSLLHQKFWFFLIVIFFSLEWGIRKYFGSY